MDDLQDAYPNDAAKQYLLQTEARPKVKDENLPGRLTNQSQDQVTTGELTRIDRGNQNIKTLNGLKNFSSILMFARSNRRSDLPLAAHG